MTKKNDCITKRDVKKFFSRLQDGILITGIIALASIGFITCTIHTIDWMEKPSKLEVLSDKVDALQQENRDLRIDAHNHTYFGNEYVIYNNTEEASTH